MAGFFFFHLSLSVHMGDIPWPENLRQTKAAFTVKQKAVV